jgi:hypothetical protein
MNTELFPISHERMLDIAECFCDECGWYGNNDETQDSNLDFDRCPECNNTTTENDARRGTHLLDDSIEEVLKELLEQTLIFNQKYGYNCWKSEPRRFNATYEIDIHGQLIFRVLSWAEFHKDNSSMDDYYILSHEDVPVFSPKHVNYTVLRDMLNDFADLVFKLEYQDQKLFVVTPEYMAFCAEECIDADDPDNHEVYLESISD